MALGTPNLQAISPFSALTLKTISFLYGSGDVVFKNNIVITNNSTNVVVYNQEQTTLLYQHMLPINTLINGVIYKIKVRIANEIGTYSSFSDEIIFKCLSNPTLSITNLLSVNSSYFEFQGSFLQSEGDTLKSYQFLLYDSNSVQIGASIVKYDGLLKHGFAGLQDNINYKIALKIDTNGGILYTSSLFSFAVEYVSPQIPAFLQLENITTTGQVKITTNIIRIDANIPDGTTYTYINNEEIDLKSSQLEYTQGINFNGNFTLKIYIRDIFDLNTFFTLYGENDTDSSKSRIELKRNGNKIYVDKNVYNNQIYQIYQEMSLTDLNNINQQFIIWLQQEDNLLSLKIELM